MNNLMLPLKKIGALLLLFGLMQGCASTGNMTGGNSREYSRNFDEMRKIVEDAVNQSNINIYDVENALKQGEVIMYISKDATNKQEHTQDDTGVVRVLKVSDTKTRVEVEDPEYEFSVPSYERVKYSNKIFDRIDELLKS